MSSFPTLAPGSLFGGDFRIERALAEGGMGAVYVAEQLSTGKRRALKIMHPQFVPDARSRGRFVEEARVGSRIDSEHVVEVVAAGIESGVPWLAMELLDGVSLDERVREHGSLSALEALTILEQVCHALAHAHARGIIHRDLKPENIFVARARRMGAPEVVKILDFGIASTIESNRTAAVVTTAIGSPLWMAPEQAQSGAELRPATDVWALGLIAFFLLTGQSYWRAAGHLGLNLNALLVEIIAAPLPPASARAAELGRSLPPRFDAWFARCVDRDAQARYAAAGPALEALRAALGGVAATIPIPVDLAPTLAPATADTTSARWPMIAGALAIVTIGVVAVSAWAMWGNDSPERERWSQPAPAVIDAGARAREVARIEYVVLSHRSFASEAELSTADVDAWMSSHTDELDREHARQRHRFTDLPPQVRARHILARTSPDAERRARRWLARLRAGEDFARLAAESDDPGTALRGGDLGWFSRGMMVAPFEQAAFAAAPGTLVADPVGTQFGFHVLEVLGAREGDVPEQEAKREIAEAMLRTERSRESARGRAEAVLDELRAGRSLQDAVDGPARWSERFSAGEHAFDGDDGSVAAAVFALAPRTAIPGAPIALGDDWVVFRIGERGDPAHLSPWTEPALRQPHPCEGSWRGAISDSHGGNGEASLSVSADARECGTLRERWGDVECSFRLTACERSETGVSASGIANERRCQSPTPIAITSCTPTSIAVEEGSGDDRASGTLRRESR